MPVNNVRVGTWNLAGRWSKAHERLLASADCDVWLLTEVHPDTRLSGYHSHRGKGRIVGRRSWAAILSREPLEAMPDPHGASAAAVVSGTVFCSTVLPWRSCRSLQPWSGSNHAAKTGAALDAIIETLSRTEPVIWGGDWNHALSGREYAGSAAGRTHLRTALGKLGLSARTEDLPHRIEGLLSIDHIAAPTGWPARAAERIPATPLSDHDAYTVQFLTRPVEGVMGWTPNAVLATPRAGRALKGR